MKFRSIQLVRGFAAILVILLHSINATNNVSYVGLALPAWLVNGYAGVDVFFIVSGFIISFAVDRERVDAKDFIFKRCVRILPFYWIATLVWIATMFTGGKRLPSPLEIANSLLLIPTSTLPILGVGWSLQQEFIFYIVVMLLIGFKRIIYLPQLLGLLFIIGIFWHVILDKSNWDYRIFSLYNLNFLLGVLIYRSRYKLAKFNSIILLASGFIAFVGAGALVSVFYEGGHVPTVPTGFAGFVRVVSFGLAGTFLISGLLALEARNSQALEAGTLQIWELIGNASYGLYLTHPIVYAVVGTIAGRLLLPPIAAWPVALIAVTSAVVFALCWYYLLEKPFLALVTSGRRGSSGVAADTST